MFLSRAERRAAEKRSRNVPRKRMAGTSRVIMALVTFAMVFSTLSMTLAYGGREAAIITVIVASIALVIMFVLMGRSES